MVGLSPNHAPEGLLHCTVGGKIEPVLDATGQSLPLTKVHANYTADSGGWKRTEGAQKDLKNNSILPNKINTINCKIMPDRERHRSQKIAGRG